MKDAEIVCAFLERIAAHDCDGALEFLVDDVFIHNMPLPPTRTREEWLQGMMAFGGDLEIDLLNIVDDGNGTVMTERMDRFRRFGQWINLPVMGAFTLKEGKIVSWREYFDLATYNDSYAKLENAAQANRVSD